MDKFKTLKYLVYLCATILIVQLAMLSWMIDPVTPYIWIGLGVVAILGLYMARIALAAIKELEDQNNKK